MIFKEPKVVKKYAYFLFDNGFALISLRTPSMSAINLKADYASIYHHLYHKSLEMLNYD